jgi:hypothetical protein
MGQKYTGHISQYINGTMYGQNSVDTIIPGSNRNSEVYFIKR